MLAKKEVEGLDSRLTLANTDPTKNYFIYFIHESGRHGENMPIKVGASNDVGEYRKKLEAGRENNLKTYVAIKCLKGDADDVIVNFVRKYADNHLQNGWFTGGKSIVDAFVSEMETLGYEKLTEGRAKLLKSGARRPPVVKPAVPDVPAVVPQEPKIPMRTRAKKNPV